MGKELQEGITNNDDGNETTFVGPIQQWEEILGKILGDKEKNIIKFKELILNKFFEGFNGLKDEQRESNLKEIRNFVKKYDLNTDEQLEIKNKVDQRILQFKYEDYQKFKFYTLKFDMTYDTKTNTISNNTYDEKKYKFISELENDFIEIIKTIKKNKKFTWD